MVLDKLGVGLEICELVRKLQDFPLIFVVGVVPLQKNDRAHFPYCQGAHDVFASCHAFFLEDPGHLWVFQQRLRQLIDARIAFAFRIDRFGQRRICSNPLNKGMAERVGNFTGLPQASKTLAF